MKTLEEFKNNKEMILTMSRNMDKPGDIIDIDALNSSGEYICTILSMSDDGINVFSGVKQALERNGVDVEELYFNENGSILVNFI